MRFHARLFRLPVNPDYTGLVIQGVKRPQWLPAVEEPGFVVEDFTNAGARAQVLERLRAYGGRIRSVSHTRDGGFACVLFGVPPAAPVVILSASLPSRRREAISGSGSST